MLCAKLFYKYFEEKIGYFCSNLLHPSCRTLEEVNKLADAAGLINRTGPVQVLHFSVSPNSDEYKLLELPPSILESLGVGNRYAI